MTVSAQTARKVSTAAAGATLFPYDFKILDAAHLEVTVDGAPKALNVDYTVDGVGNAAGGNLIFLVPMAGGETVMRRRAMPYTRETDYQVLGDLRSSSLNNDLDAAVLMAQQLADVTSRAMVLPPEVVGVVPELPAPVPGGLLGWNADGTGMENKASPSDAVTYTAPAGGVTRSVGSRLGEDVSVLDYINPSLHAAILAGTNTDDLTPALDLAAAAAVGRILSFPPGIYHATNWGLPNDTTIRAARGAILRVHPAATPGNALVRNALLDSLTPARIAARIDIDGLTFDGNNLAYPLWLQNPTTGAAIADPQNDYFANGGKILDPAYAQDADSVCLAQTRASAGNLTINGALASAGTANLAPAVRKIEIAGAGNNAAVNFTVTGADVNNAVQSETIAGPNNGTVTTTKLFKTVAQVASSAAIAGNVTVGSSAFDIFGTVAEGRRNPAYTLIGALAKFSKVDGLRLTRCRFTNHNNMAILEAGGRDVLIEDCDFDNVGKADGAFPAIWTQSLGTPATPPAYYAGSENVVVRGNRARNLRRMFALFAPTLGGEITDNVIENTRESGIYLPTNLNYDGGRAVCARNKISSVTMSDIVANAIECEAPKNLDILDNYIFQPSQSGMILTGARNVNVIGNRLRNCYWRFEATYPYGPFAERYGYNVGTTPLAGTATPLVTDGQFFSLGILDGVGCDRLRIAHNLITDTRPLVFPPIFRQTKTGGSSLATNCWIEHNQLDLAGANAFLDTTTGTVWKSEMPLWIRGNTNHASEAPVVIPYTFPAATTGIVTFNPGFRPSLIVVQAAGAAAATNLRTWRGQVPWTRAPGAASASGVYATTDGVTQATAGLASEFIRTVNAAGVAQHSSEFQSYTETGFKVSVIVATEAVDAQIICYP